MVSSNILPTTSAIRSLEEICRCLKLVPMSLSLLPMRVIPSISELIVFASISRNVSSVSGMWDCCPVERATEGAHDRGSGSLLYWVLAYLALMEPSVERLEGTPVVMLF